MLVSCVIPTRDRLHLIDSAVASVLAQEGAAIEVIVVDDGSTDGTSLTLPMLFPEIRLVTLAGKGPGPARNAGAAVARGEVLMFLDSDDVWLPGHAEALLGAIDRGYAAAYGAARTVDTSNGAAFFIPDDGQAVEGDCFKRLLRWCFLVPSAFCVTRQAFIEAGGFVEADLGEDWEFFLRLADRHHFGFAGPAPITERYLHDGSLCVLNGGRGFLNALALVEQTAARSGRLDRDDRQWLSEVRKWSVQNRQEKKTVQDWYLAMKEDGLLAGILS